ncbi:MAG: hypothetical protein OIN86_08645 [Candidatus Methanoperedens sp.]|nr:hypothetical protein [Candidatus Methanoperedens sp.]CAG1006450.1 hypothetical protein METP1_03344 [Methanosarcinales archaeon]
MKLITSEKAEAEVIGHIIILSITILGIGMITLFGVPAIYTLEDMANSKNVEQAFTVLDSRASRVTLGDSPLQITNIELGGGTLTVEPNSSNNSGYIFVNSSDFNFTIPMGRIKYTLGDRIVSYEGGGVWALYPGGGTVMLSPPEFHYNGWTLTLPVINVSGNASVGGKGTAVVSVKKMATIIQYPNASIAGRTNPVNGSNNGIVNVNITSDYYKSWADYARTLSYTNVSVNDKNKTAIIVLEVISPMGTFVSIPSEITMRNINMSSSAPLTNLSFDLYKDVKGGACGARNWYATATKGLAELKIGVEHEQGCNYKMIIEYTSETSVEEEWNSIGIVSTDPEKVDFLNKSLNLTLDDSPCPTWSPVICTSSTNYSSFDLIQHYILLIGPDVIFQTDPGNRVDSTKSSFTLYYDPGPGALTYLHVTENRADVGIS